MMVLASQPSDDIAMVTDFDARGDTLWVLETGSELNRYELRDGRWHQAAKIAGRGEGPGELRDARGVALTRDGIAVNDAARVHYFDDRGTFVRSSSLGLPCMMLRPRLVWADAGVYLHGSCIRKGFRADTMKAILAFATDTLMWQVVSEDIHYVTDGSSGSVFGPGIAFTPGSTHHLFGTSADDCVQRIDADGSAGGKTCGIASRTYSSAPPASVVARSGGRSVRGIRVDWPDPLPAYMDRLVTPAGDLVLRPFSVDSLLLQRIDGQREDIAVVPFNTLVGCKAAGCLWVEEDEVTRVLLLRPQQAAAYMNGAMHDP